MANTISYTTPTGATATGYVKDGKTYTDPNFTNRVPVGSTVVTQGGTFVMTATGGQKVSDPTTTTAPTTPVAAAAPTVASAPSTTTYTDANGVQRIGYVKDGRTYADSNYTTRIPVGSVVDTQGGRFILTDTGSMLYDDYLATQQGKLTTTSKALNTAGADYNAPAMQDISLGDQFGLNYDYDSILSLLNNATTASFAAEREAAKTSENTFYNNMADTQQTTLDTLRKAQASAIATGASKGRAAAAELSAVLGLQDTASEEANVLANARTQLNGKQQAAMDANASTALNTSNSVKEAIANLAATIYGYDTQGSIGVLDYLAALASDATNAYSADQTLNGVKYNADQNLASTLTAAKASTSSASGTKSTSTSTPTTSTKAGTTTAIKGTNDYLVQQSDGTWTLYKEVDGKYKQIEGVSAAQKDTMLAEGSSNAIDPGYAGGVMGTTVTDGTTLTAGGKTWTWNAASQKWSSGSETMSSAALKTLQTKDATTITQTLTSQKWTADAIASNPAGFATWKTDCTKNGLSVGQDLNGTWSAVKMGSITP